MAGYRPGVPAARDDVVGSEVARTVANQRTRDVEAEANAMASMISDYLRGVPIVLAELPEPARRRITAYTHAATLGAVGIRGHDQHGLLPDVPHVEREHAARPGEGKVIDGEVLPAQPASEPCAHCSKPAISRVRISSQAGRVMSLEAVCDEHRAAEQRLAIIGMAQVDFLPLDGEVL